MVDATMRALENTSISDWKIPPELIRALGVVMAAAAEANRDLGLVEPALANAIHEAASEVGRGAWDEHFQVDVFQTGSGTSWNMNANEVIANRANELLSAPRGAKIPVHPNDHVNRCQSSNDVIPTAINMACRAGSADLGAALESLQRSLERKTREFSSILKVGRTHLQDAVPMTLGQEFSGYARQVEKACHLLLRCFPSLEELAIGGTAVGTGINSHPDFARRAVAGITADAARTGIAFREAVNRFEAMAARDAQVELMGAVNAAAVCLTKIANDLRLLSSSPRTGFGEISLPSFQPGSSIMPGKVNPVILEMTLQAAAHIMGACFAVSIGSQTGPLEMNMMQPLIAAETLGALRLVAGTCCALAAKCVDGIAADAARGGMGGKKPGARHAPRAPDRLRPRREARAEGPGRKPLDPGGRDFGGRSHSGGSQEDPGSPLDARPAGLRGLETRSGKGLVWS